MAAATFDVLASMHLSLLARAKELDPVDGEDMLQDAYVRFLERPPRSKSPLKVKHWFRTVLLRMHIDRERARKVPALAPPDA